MPETVELTKERYEELLEAEDKLNALIEFGVDNWEGFSEAMESLEEN